MIEVHPEGYIDKPDSNTTLNRQDVRSRFGLAKWLLLFSLRHLFSASEQIYNQFNEVVSDG